jgi:hypothetical protein
MQSARREWHPVPRREPVETRRSFVSAIFLAAAVPAWLVGATGLSQLPPPPPQAPGRKPSSDQGPDAPELPSADKHILDENEKEIKKKVERLYDLASELKAQVEKTDSSKVLSLNLIRKAEEIEKLAHDIKTRSKG